MNIMKLKYILIVAALSVATAFTMDAQVGRRFYIDAGWQFNGTFSNNFVRNASGWGAYAEGGYYILPHVGVGAFASFNTNNEYIPKATYDLGNGADLTTDMAHSLFQIPFGAELRYRFTYTRFQPYVGAKLGANYAEAYRFMSTFGMRDSGWGFYVSPEIGFTWHPFRKSNFGFQLAAYYAYSTNRSEAFNINGINNAGFKLGLSF